MIEPVSRTRTRIPPAFAGQAIGLFGGSFDPPHEGHLLVAETALVRLGLDRLWWMVTPGNPLKDTSGLAPLAERLAACDALTSHPRIVVTAPEARLSSRFTADTLATLVARRPGVRFVWVMGADNLATFHRWERWRTIADLMPIAVIDRPGATLAFGNAPAAQALARYRVDEADARILPHLDPPAWTFLHGPRSGQSSTALRAMRKRES